MQPASKNYQYHYLDNVCFFFLFFSFLLQIVFICSWHSFGFPAFQFTKLPLMPRIRAIDCYVQGFLPVQYSNDLCFNNIHHLHLEIFPYIFKTPFKHYPWFCTFKPSDPSIKATSAVRSHFWKPTAWPETIGNTVVPLL